jgi:hypothetical protein
MAKENKGHALNALFIVGEALILILYFFVAEYDTGVKLKYADDYSAI